MLTDAQREEVAALAGVVPKETRAASGTRAKLKRKQRPSKALKAKGKIQGRATSSERKLALRQKNPKRTMYRSKASRKSKLDKKLSFQRAGESGARVADLVEEMRNLLKMT